MSTGAVVYPPSAGAIGGATAPSGQGTRPLTSEAIFRIEVSLSSRKSSAIVMKTTARLYSLDGAVPAVPGASPGKDAEWKPVAYGAPCIQLMRESTSLNSPFHIKMVIAEVESGISLWELEVDKSSQYNAMQKNFHTFSVGGKTYAIQFANDREADRMLESVLDLFEQKEKAETVSFEKKPTEPIFKKPKSIRKLNKKDISTPCNFKHVSGITLQRTQTCEDELRGTIQRKMRSMSLSSLSRRKMRQRQVEEAKMAATNGPVVALSGNSGGLEAREFKGLDVSPMIARKTAGKDSPKIGRSNSILHKFGSLRLTKKKPHSQASVKGESGQPDSAVDGQMTRDKVRMSLPSHYRPQGRPALTGDLFDGAGVMSDQNGASFRPLSRSSENLAETTPTTHNTTVSSPTRKAATLDRRHTFVGPTSPYRKNSGTGGGSTQFNYTPYSKSSAPGSSPRHQTSSTLDQQFQQYQKMMSNGGVSYQHTKSATLGSHSAQHFQQQMRGYASMEGSRESGGGVGGVASGSNLASSAGRLHMSDMGLHRTGPTGYTSGYGAPPPQGGRRLSVNDSVMMNGQGQMPPKGNRMSSSGGIPVQPPIANGSMQSYHYSVPKPHRGGQPHPQQMVSPTTPTGSVTMGAPPTSSAVMTMPNTSQNGYYPPTAQPQGGYDVPRGVMSAPQQQPYPVQSGVHVSPNRSGHYRGQQNQGNYPPSPVSGPSTLPVSAAQVTSVNGVPHQSNIGTSAGGDPLPYSSASTSGPVIGQSSQTGVRTSPGRRGGGPSVLSKPAASPHRQTSVPHSGSGNRPREVITSQTPLSYYDTPRVPSQQPASFPGNQPPQSSAAPRMMAPLPTKYTNLQLHQQYHQQYLKMQGNKTTPYQMHGSTTRPSMQRYQEYAQYEREQQKQQPPPVAKKSPPKYHTPQSQSHGHSLMNGSSSHSHPQGSSMHRQQFQPESQIPPQSLPQQQQRRHYQQPNNASNGGSSPYMTGKTLPHMQVNRTNSNGDSSHELVPRPNQNSHYQPQPYNALPTENESSTSIDTLDINDSLASVTDELDRFTEEMSRALEQFDSLLQPQNTNPLAQT